MTNIDNTCECHFVYPHKSEMQDSNDIKNECHLLRMALLHVPCDESTITPGSNDWKKKKKKEKLCLWMHETGQALFAKDKTNTG